MAVLQSARARTLGLSQDSALSWGLNRAIFYAAAKRGFRGSPPTEGASSKAATEDASREIFRLGDEEAYRDRKSSELVFTIGDQDQTAAEFDRAVVARFGTKENFRAAWEEAMQIVAKFDRETLESRRGFYDEVYRPRRDDLSDAWTRQYSPPRKVKQ